MSLHKYIRIAAALLFTSLSPMQANASSKATQNLDTIEQTAIAFAKRNSAPGDEIQAQPLDRRLVLSECSRSLKAFQLGRVNRTANRQTVGVRCEGTTPWKVYVSLRRETYVSVPVAVRYLGAGHILTEQDLRLERRASSQLGSLAAHDMNAILGKKLRRGVQAEQAIPVNTLLAEKLIKRGQHIDIIADLPGIRVRVAGIADSDGVANQRIWVKNLSSGQKIQAKVVSDNAVLATSL